MFGKKDQLPPEQVKAELAKITDPELGQDLVTLGMVKSISAEGGRVRIELELPTPAWEPKEALEQQIRTRLGDGSIEIVTSSKVQSSRPDAAAGENLVPGAKNIILFSSAKGGVGKSTVASNVASALAKAGASVGLLDADIYGPSIPTMFGTREMPQITDGGSKLIPVQRYGLKLMSIGFVVDPKEAMSWRGPMLNGALIQFMRDVEWGELDYLVLDLPPGTGDVQLTIAQNVKVSGAVLVSTPQDVALSDVVRGKSMFDRVGIPCLGVVENMSAFECTTCGTVHHIFSHGGAARLAKELNIPLLAEIPIELGVRESSDQGKPEVLARPESKSALAFTGLARRVATVLAKQAHANMGKRSVASRLRIVQ